MSGESQGQNLSTPQCNLSHSQIVKVSGLYLLNWLRNNPLNRVIARPGRFMTDFDLSVKNKPFLFYKTHRKKNQYFPRYSVFWKSYVTVERNSGLRVTRKLFQCLWTCVLPLPTFIFLISWQVGQIWLKEMKRRYISVLELWWSKLMFVLLNKKIYLWGTVLWTFPRSCQPYFQLVYRHHYWRTWVFQLNSSLCISWLAK